MGRPIKKGSTDQSTVIRIIDSTTGLAEDGVVYDTAGIDLWFRREKEDVTSITEASLASLVTAHLDGGIILIKNGYYRLDLPDPATAAGANENSVQIGGAVTGMIVIGNEHPLVDYDPYDTIRMGMTALPAAAADAAGGLPISDGGGLDMDNLASIQAEILMDTGTTLPATLASILLDTDISIPSTLAIILEDTGTTLPATLASILLDTDVSIPSTLATILEDTATTLPATLASILLDTDVSIPSALANILVDTATIILDTDVSIPSTLANILVDTAAILLDTDISIPSTLAKILEDTGTTLDTAISAIPTTMVGTNNAALASICTEERLAELDAQNMPSDAAAIRVDTQTDGVVLKAAGLNADAVDLIHDEVMEGTMTFRQAIKLFLSVLTGKSSGGGTTTVVFRDIGDTKNRISATVDSDGNRTAVGTRDGA